MNNKDAIWKKDYTAERRRDAELFIKEAFSKEAKKPDDSKKGPGLGTAAGFAVGLPTLGTAGQIAATRKMAPYSQAGNFRNITMGDLPELEQELYGEGGTKGYFKDVKKYKDNLDKEMAATRKNLMMQGIEGDELEELLKEYKEGIGGVEGLIRDMEIAASERKAKGVSDLDVSGYSQTIQDKVKELRAKGVKIQDDLPESVTQAFQEAFDKIDKLRAEGKGGFSVDAQEKLLRGAQSIQGNIRNFGGAVAAPNAIGLMPGTHEAILAHELGHVDQGRIGKVINRAGSFGQLISKIPGMNAAPGLAAGIGALRAGDKETAEDRDKAYRQAQVATGVLGLPAGLSALEEGRANINALNMGRKAGKFKEYAKVLAPAYGTYLAKASIPGMALGGLEYLRRKGKKKNKPMTKKAMRGKIIGGSTLLGALALGGNEYMKSRVNPETGITRREAARQARQAQDDTYASLTGKRRNALIRKGEQAVEAAGQKMDERKDIAVPAMAAAGGLTGGMAAKKALDFIKKNKRALGV